MGHGRPNGRRRGQGRPRSPSWITPAPEHAQAAVHLAGVNCSPIWPGLLPISLEAALNEDGAAVCARRARRASALVAVSRTAHGVGCQWEICQQSAAGYCRADRASGPRCAAGMRTVRDTAAAPLVVRMATCPAVLEQSHPYFSKTRCREIRARPPRADQTLRVDPPPPHTHTHTHHPPTCRWR